MPKKLATTAQSVQPLATHTSLPAQHAQPTVNLTTPPPPAALWRLPEVLRNVPVSRATLYSWIEQGRFPKPIKIGPRAVAWRSADILALTV
jgi:predicted DNA-binding transcriptional regulator AlpA